MADPNLRLPQNTTGSFYVDDTCVDCDRCRSDAPEFFMRDDTSGTSYVHRQPVTATEFAQAERARLDCPTDSIGRDEVLEPADRDE